MELMGLETAGTLQECIAYYVMSTIVLIIVAMLLIIFQPYKAELSLLIQF